MRWGLMFSRAADFLLCSRNTVLLTWRIDQVQQKGMIYHTECCLCWDSHKIKFSSPAPIFWCKCLLATFYLRSSQRKNCAVASIFSRYWDSKEIPCEFCVKQGRHWMCFCTWQIGKIEVWEKGVEQCLLSCSSPLSLQNRGAQGITYDSEYLY